MHDVFGCQEIQPMWNVYIPFLCSAHNIPCIVGFLILVVMNGSKKDLAKVICSAWCLCSRRNGKVYKGKCVQSLEAFEKAISILSNFQASPQQNVAQKQKVMKWEPPLIGCHKLNVNGALFFDLQKSSIGCVIRDHSGKLLLATSLAVRDAHDLGTIEALALLRSFQLCMYQGFQNLIIESDFLVDEVLS